MSLGQTVRVVDSLATQILYVKQKAFRLKADVIVYADEQQAQPVYRIRGDRVLGSVKYTVGTIDGQPLGSLQRQWGSAMWRATYKIFDRNDVQIGTIRQQNPWIRVLHGLAEEIPLVGPIVGMYVNPTYAVDVPEGSTVMKLVKKRSFVSRSFVIDSVVPLRREVDEVVLPAVLTFALMERARA
jgi:uncharacterized protein YxjI